jgi:branched-chain amino acid transport system ATP-binding protein
MNVLEIRGLVKNFGKLAAIAGVDLDFRKGEFASIIGPNGAGKTTLFHVVTGKLAPSAGTIQFNGQDISRLPAHKIARLGLGRIFQITNLFPELTVYENIKVSVLAKRRETLRMFTLSGSMRQADQETERILEVVGLADKKDALCGALSHGDQRLIEIGVALAIHPVLLLLDEPTGGMGPEETDRMVQFIRDLSAREQVTILLVEHDMKVVFSVSERIVVMHQGLVIADGSPEEIRRNEKVREAYLGEEHADR